MNCIQVIRFTLAAISEEDLLILFASLLFFVVTTCNTSYGSYLVTHEDTSKRTIAHNITLLRYYTEMQI